MYLDFLVGMGLALVAFRIALRATLWLALLLVVRSDRPSTARVILGLGVVGAAVFATFAGRVTTAYASLPGAMHSWTYAVTGLVCILLVLAGNNTSIDTQEELAAFKAEMLGVLMGVTTFFVAFEWPWLPDLVPGALQVTAFFVFVGAKLNSLPWVRIPVLIMGGIGVLRLLVTIVGAIASSGRKSTIAGH